MRMRDNVDHVPFNNPWLMVVRIHPAGQILFSRACGTPKTFGSGSIPDGAVEVRIFAAEQIDTKVNR